MLRLFPLFLAILLVSPIAFASRDQAAETVWFASASIVDVPLYFAAATAGRALVCTGASSFYAQSPVCDEPWRDIVTRTGPAQ